MELKDTIKERLKNVIDPEIGINIVDLGLIYDVTVDGKKAHVKMTMTSPFCPAAGMITEGVKQNAESVEEIDECEVEVTFDPPWTPEKMSEEAREELGVSMDVF